MNSGNMASKYLIVLWAQPGLAKRLSIRLSTHYNAPILSADSRQFFRELRIGTAAPTSAQMNAAEHYFIGHKRYRTVYCECLNWMPLQNLKNIYNKRCSPAGGSMLYINAVCQGIDDFPLPILICGEVWKSR